MEELVISSRKDSQIVVQDQPDQKRDLKKIERGMGLFFCLFVDAVSWNWQHLFTFFFLFEQIQIINRYNSNIQVTH